MWLESLELSNFRNFDKLKLKLDRKVNLFIGNNAQGKTNIIESVYLLATTKSFRAIRDSDLIKWGHSESSVYGRFGANEIRTVIGTETKKVYLNRGLKSKSDIIGKIPIVLFSPESINIVTGSPDKRRRFLDQTLSIVDKNYLFSLGRFLRTLKNRNRLLLSMRQGYKADLGIWDKQLANLGSLIWRRRIDFANYANRTLRLVAQSLVDSIVRIEYNPEVKKIDSEAELKKYIENKLGRLRSLDLARGVATFGPHRDDFKIFFDKLAGSKVFEKEVGYFGSRGEQRIATLALKLIEVDFLEKNFGERPILLLDDILSEFDQRNREHIIKLLPRQQSIITSTSLDYFSDKGSSYLVVYEVNDGKVTKLAAS